MSQNAEILASRLQDVKSFKVKYPKVFSSFDPEDKLFEEWERKLDKKLYDLADEMESLSAVKQNQALNDKLKIVKSLSQLDEVLGKDKCRQVYSKYQDQFHKSAPSQLQKGIDAVKSKDYSSVFSIMSTLEQESKSGIILSKDHLDQLTKILNDDLGFFIERTVSMARMVQMIENTTPEKIQPIEDNLAKIQLAETLLSKFLNPGVNINDKISRIVKTVSNAVLELLKNIKNLMDSHNFIELDKKRKSFNLICDILSTHCEQVVFDELKKLEEVETTLFENLTKKYSELDIKQYFMHPPKDICKKLEQAQETNSNCGITLQKIEQNIVDKFRRELENAKSLEQVDTLPNPHLRAFESALNSLPGNLKDQLRLDLQNCKDDLQKSMDDYKAELENISQSSDPIRMRNFLVKCKGERRSSTIKSAKNVVSKQIQETVVEINNMLENEDLLGATLPIKKLYSFKENLAEDMNEIKSACINVRDRLLKIFNEACTSFKIPLLDSDVTLSEESCKKVEKSFDCLVDFLALVSRLDEYEISQELFGEDIKQNLLESHEIVSNLILNQQKKYRESVETNNHFLLKDVLDAMKRYDSLITKIKRYADNSNKVSTRTLSEVFKKIEPYDEMSKFATKLFQDLKEKLINEKLINSNTTGIEKSREEFYTNLDKIISVLMSVEEFTDHLKFHVENFKKGCQTSLTEKTNEIFVSAKRIMSEENSSESDYENFNQYYLNLTSLTKNVSFSKYEGKRKTDELDQLVHDKIQSLVRSFGEFESIGSVSKLLIKMKSLSDYLSSFKTKFDEKIDEVLALFRSKKGAKSLSQLGTILNQDKGGIGQSIISEHKCFKGFSLSLFNQRTQTHGIDYVMEKLEGTEIDKKALKRRYDAFMDCYEELVKLNLKPKLDLEPLISEIHLMTKISTDKDNGIIWDSSVTGKIPTLIAHICALWTLQNSTHYFEAEGVNDQKSYLFKPHAAQIISIFRMLGSGDSKEKLRNNLVQIGTGEGKSVTLAITASVFALFGFDVNCACYSEYLSKRDYADFEPLFASLNLQNNIHYGTFNKLCEGIINQDGEIRQLVHDLILTNNHKKSSNKASKRPKILLIDEVDVFFSKDFYGNIYTPSTSLRDPIITNLIDWIWKNKDSQLNINTIKQTQEFRACYDKFRTWGCLIEEAVKDMIFDVKSYTSHDYIVNNNKIGYKEQDNIAYNVFYGYKTLFAYYDENAKGGITNESLQENKSIKLKCGTFSYAEVPNMFRFIMGVTGTLKTLSDPEKKVIEDLYQVKKQTYSPSVFGANNLAFSEKDDVLIEDNNDYLNVIAREIHSKLQGRSAGTQRAVLVFFESKKTLQQFYNSPSAQILKDNINILTEEASLQEKGNFVKRATTSGQITLLTRVLGRGTDFICRDEIVNTNNGVHVIQTFLSEELSEEVQIKGRTARQGQNGSYSMVLLDSSLEKFLITKDEISSVRDGKGGLFSIMKKYRSIYDLLNKKRNDFFKAQYNNNSEFLSEIKEQHQNSIDFLRQIVSGESEAVQKFLLDKNRGVSNSGGSRTIVLMDATGSMSLLLQNAKNTVDKMFSRTHDILKDHRLNQDSFQLQFVVYRNYNSTIDSILQSSPWETKPENLRAFMEKISPDGGWVNEAIELGLWHANTEDEKQNISQIILIGDAPANTKAEVVGKRNMFKEKYWSKTALKKPTYYADELQRLREKNIPIHTFFVSKSAEKQLQRNLW